jgi:hypothetical protein
MYLVVFKIGATFSHYSNCARTDQLENPMTGDDHNTGVGLDHNLICNKYKLKVDHNNTITSTILHKVSTK